MSKKNLLLILLLPIYFFSFGQHVNEEDSLKALLPEQSDQEQVLTLNELSFLFMHTNPDKSGDYARQAYGIAQNNNDKEGLALIANKLGMYFYQIAQYDSSKYYYRQSVNIADKIHNNHIKFNALTGLAYILKTEMKYDSAKLILAEALKISESLNEPKYLAPVYASLADLIASQSDSDSALSLIYKAVNLYREINDSINMAISLNNMAAMMIQAGKQVNALSHLKESIKICRQKKYNEILLLNLSNIADCYKGIDSLEQALNYQEEALFIEKQKNNQLNMAKSYMSLGNILVMSGNFDKASLYLDSSMRICQELSIDYGILLNTINRGNLHLKAGQHKLAIVYLRESLRLVEPFSGLKYEKLEILKDLYTAFKNQSKSDSALVYYEQYIQIMDTLNKKSVDEKIALLENKYQHEKHLNKITLLQNQVFQMKTMQQTYLIFIILVGFAIFTYLLIRRNKIKNKKLKLQLVQKEKEKLEIELKSQKKELMVNAMHMARINEITYGITQKLKLLTNSLTANNKFYLSEIVKELELSAHENSWEEFETRFEHVHQDFYHALNQLYPELTPNEIKICSFIRLNMSSKDIALLTNRSVRTIESTRNNIRKKLQIEHGASLAKFLLSL